MCGVCVNNISSVTGLLEPLQLRTYGRETQSTIHSKIIPTRYDFELKLSI
jgi:hypothetical protein